MRLLTLQMSSAAEAGEAAAAASGGAAAAVAAPARAAEAPAVAAAPVDKEAAKPRVPLSDPVTITELALVKPGCCVAILRCPLNLQRGRGSSN